MTVLTKVGDLMRKEAGTLHGITRDIGIDAAHRVPLHGSKCRCLHGHRYHIEAYCQGPLAESGEQSGMTLDFGFLKDEMMKEIDQPCDHATILWSKDPLAKLLIPDLDFNEVNSEIEALGFHFTETSSALIPFKLYFIPFIPTAENLARHWYERLLPRVVERSEERAALVKVVVHETPNCRAYYPL